MNIDQGQLQDVEIDDQSGEDQVYQQPQKYDCIRNMFYTEAFHLQRLR